jgi:hypothetical protein
MDYVIEISGGIGKHIMATSFIKWLNEKYPKKKIIVVSVYPEIFEYNPRIYRNLRLDQPYLFEDYIKGNDYRKGEPYNLFEYYHKKKHLCEVFPKAYRFNQLNKKFETEIYLTKGEEMDGQMYCQQNKPLITFQPFGGLPPGMQPNRMKMDSSQRDIPPKLAVDIANQLVSKGFRVLQLRGPTEMPIYGLLQLELPFRNMLPIIKHSIGHVGIDSVGMHSAAVFKKPQLIFWGQTHKNNLGYNYGGVINSSNEFGMHRRPHCQLPDREGIYPYKSKKEGLEFEYSEKDLNKQINLFLDELK